MGLRTCARPSRLAVDVLLAVFFVLVDIVSTLAGLSWWPAHPRALAWALLGAQERPDSSSSRRRQRT